MPSSYRREFLIPCQPMEGLFRNEVGIELSGGNQTISLFVDRSFIQEDGDRSYLRAEQVDENYVRLPGERMDFGSPMVLISSVASVSAA